MLARTMDTQVVAIQIWPLQIPLRKPFKHAAAERTVADPILIEVELADGTIGFGETVARSYVTRETPATVEAAIRTTLLEPLVSARPQSMPEALELAESLPWQDRDRQTCPAARAGLELALLDAYGRRFGRSPAQMAGWFGIAGFEPPGSIRHVRVARVLGAAEPAKLARQVRLARWFGVRDFKVKVGDADPAVDRARLEAVLSVLGRALARRRATLRVDANGAWTPRQAVEVLRGWRGLPIAAVEQPTPPGTQEHWPELHAACELPIMADESLVTMHDAESLVQSGAAQAFNIRIAKNGGLTAAIRLAAFARRRGLTVMIGCMVGETAILSAALVQLLCVIDNATFVEGCYGSWLLRDDVGRRVQFSFGGRLPGAHGPGLGARVMRERLVRLCPDGPRRLAP